MKAKHLPNLFICIILFLSSQAGLSQSMTNVGKEFWIAFQPNVDNNPPQLFINISSEFATNGFISSSYPGINQIFSVVPGVVTQITIPSGVIQQSGIENKGIRITSNNPISVYGVSQGEFSTDAFLALPVIALGNDYRIVTFTAFSPVLRARYSVLAVEDNTNVTIFNKWTNATKSYILNKGQTLLSNDVWATDQDVTGSRVQSDKPVVVFGSNDQTRIPTLNCQASDHIVEQMFPSYSLGKEFAVLNLAGRDNSGDIIRIVADKDGTAIKINAVTVATINAGEFYQANLTGFNMINSSKPVMVAQFAKGIKCSGDITGDPFMMLIPPLEQFLTHYTIINHAFASNWVNVIAPDTAIGSIFMDGSLVPSSEFTQIGSTNYFGAQLNVVEGSHTFSSNFPIGVFVYGWKNANSYGYPGGCSISPAASISTITLSPDTSYGQLNVTSVCVNAHVTDSQNNSLKGILVNFNISGLSSLSGFAYTDSLGNAQFCYTRSGITPGIDHIYAESSGIISNSVIVFWNNTIPCINPSDGGIIGNSQNGCGNYLAEPLLNLMSPSGQSGIIEYKWQLSTIGSSSGFSDIPGSNSNSFNLGILSQTTWFKRIARVDCESDWTGAAESNVIQITVIPLTIVFNDDSLNISPTTCGGQNGSITGLIISGTAPLSIIWKNKISGQVLGHTGELYNLAVGLYELSITDGNGCSLPAISYVIKDVGDIMIDTVNYSASDCNKPNGIINVVAVSGLGSRIQYFVRSGNDTISQWHHGDFPGLATGTYYIWVTDSSGCTSVYCKPVQIINPPGPQVTSAIVIPATYLHSDGKIMISATSTSDTLYYSLNGGTAQINNGNFNNLASGLYTCMVTDEKGCDTNFTVNIGEIYSVRLEAIAGDGSACLGNVAVLPLLANSFEHVKSFKAQLKYNSALLTCQNHLNVNPALFADSLHVDLFPASGELSIKWTGKTPVSLQDGSTLVELSFASLNAGQDSLKWDISPGICVFTDSLGNSINRELVQGKVRVYSIPEADVTQPLTTCEGADLQLAANYHTGTGNGTISYLWSGPGGFASNTNSITLTSVTPSSAGQYSVSLSDTNHCQNQYSTEVNVTPTPVSGFTNDTLLFDQTYTLEANPGYYRYTWSTTDSTYSITVTAEGWYKVTLTTIGGCTATDSVLMLTAFAPLTMPNAFTPNGDILNDVFKPVTTPEKISSYTLYMYDRWGKQVYFTNDVTQGWDGIIDGAAAPVGTYVYYVKYSNTSGAVREKRGMVVLVR